MAVNWLRKAVGEISKIRNNMIGMVTTGGGNTYTLDSSRVDYRLARALYKNDEDSYKLGAGFCKPIINSKTGFMGVPSFLAKEEDEQEVLDNFFGSNRSKMSNTHKKALMEGDCLVWVTREETDVILFPETKTKLVYNIIPNEEVSQIIRNPINKNVEGYVLRSTNEWIDENGTKRKTNVTQKITTNQRIIKLEGDTVPGISNLIEETNPWGFIPIIHFRNEADETRLFGESELESIEPFLKAYHDVMLHALQGSKMHSTPRLKFKLKDVAAFLRNNFNITDPVKFAQEGKSISLDGHEFLILTDDEDAQFIEVKSSTGDAAALLKLIFYCIVDTSETPEFIFGVHTPGALASVKEQMPVFNRTITRKRDNFTESWQRLARIVLAMTAQSEGRKFSSYATELEWEEIDPRNEKEVAETLDLIASALDKAVQGEFLSVDAAVEFLKEYIPTMKDYRDEGSDEDDEYTRIMKNKIVRERLADGALNLGEKEDIDKVLAGAAV